MILNCSPLSEVVLLFKKKNVIGSFIKQTVQSYVGCSSSFDHFHHNSHHSNRTFLLTESNQPVQGLGLDPSINPKGPIEHLPSSLPSNQTPSPTSQIPAEPHIRVPSHCLIFLSILCLPYNFGNSFIQISSSQVTPYPKPNLP